MSMKGKTAIVTGGSRGIGKAVCLKLARRCCNIVLSFAGNTAAAGQIAAEYQALAERFRTEPFGEMELPVLFNCLGREMGPGDTIPALLERQVQSSVYMEDAIRRLEELGVDAIVEIGPGKALSGFVKKTAPEIKTYAVETVADVEALTAALKG